MKLVWLSGRERATPWRNLTAVIVGAWVTSSLALAPLTGVFRPGVAPRAQTRGHTSGD